MGPLVIIRNIFSVLGLALLAAALFLVYSTRSFLARAEAVTGTVVEMQATRSNKSTSYSPVVDYTTAEGRSIRHYSSFATNPPSYHVGEPVTVYYLKDKPEKAKLEGFFSLWGISLILGGLGFVFFAIGAGMRLAAQLAERKEADLRQNGTPVLTQYQAVRLNTSLRVNGRHPFQIVTQWLNPQTGKLHLFHSENLWFDPTSFAEGRGITVYLDRQKPKRYFMDVSFLPKTVE